MNRQSIRILLSRDQLLAHSVLCLSIRICNSHISQACALNTVVIPTLCSDLGRRSASSPRNYNRLNFRSSYLTLVSVNLAKEEESWRIKDTRLESE